MDTVPSSLRETPWLSADTAAPDTVIVNDALAVLPPRSVTVHVTSVEPIGNSAPEPPGLHTTGRRPSISLLPSAVNDTLAPAALVAGTEMSAGTEIVRSGWLGPSMMNDPLAGR